MEPTEWSEAFVVHLASYLALERVPLSDLQRAEIINSFGLATGRQTATAPLLDPSLSTHMLRRGSNVV